MLVREVINTENKTKLYVKVWDLYVEIDTEQVQTNTINIRTINYDATTNLIPTSTIILDDEPKPILPINI